MEPGEEAEQRCCGIITGITKNKEYDFLLCDTDDYTISFGRREEIQMEFVGFFWRGGEES